MSANLKQGARFIVAGGIAFAVDGAVLTTLTELAGVDPYSARIVAIAVAMVVAYFAHRTLTFAVNEPPSVAQFLRFAGVAASVSVLNYAIYAAILMFDPGTSPLLAFVIATGGSMFVSFFSYRHGVFKSPEL
ncbi:MAG: GtrA family protein [Hyphomicrobium sp.]|nr:GtrA family protein [Hyphomicrobium sp.]